MTASNTNLEQSMLPAKQHKSFVMFSTEEKKLRAFQLSNTDNTSKILLHNPMNKYAQKFCFTEIS